MRRCFVRVCFKDLPSVNGATTVLLLLGKIVLGWTTGPRQKSTTWPLAHAPSTWRTPTQQAGPTVTGPFCKVFPLLLCVHLASCQVVAACAPAARSPQSPLTVSPAGLPWVSSTICAATGTGLKSLAGVC